MIIDYNYGDVYQFSTYPGVVWTWSAVFVEPPAPPIELNQPTCATVVQVGPACATVTQ